MRAVRKFVTLGVLSVLGLLVLGAAPALAGPVFNLDIHHNETNFPPGGTAEYWFDVENVGDTATSGPATVTLSLPTGLTFALFRNNLDQILSNEVQWSCPAAPGSSTVTCTTSGSIPRHSMSRSLVVTVNVGASVPPGTVRFASARVSGGGAPEAPSSAGCPPAVAACTLETTRIDPATAAFGIVEGSFKADFFDADSVTPERRSGAHPDLAVFSFDLPSEHVAVDSSGVARKQAVEAVRDVSVDLPRGFVGAPTAVGECTAAQLMVSTCPPSSQVGRADINVRQATQTKFHQITTGIFNLTHPRGAITDLAFSVLGNPVHIRASLVAERGYAVTTTTPDINETLPPFNARITVWGVPSDPAHDAERCGSFSGNPLYGRTFDECAAGLPRKPFLTVPFECGVEHQMRLHSYDSWEDSGNFGPDVGYTMPGSMQGCDVSLFDPRVDAIPTGREANTPTGLDVSIRVPQSDSAIAPGSPPVKSTVVTFPEGVSFNPAFADGLDGCSMEQFGVSASGVLNGDPIACPDNSRIGDVSIVTPLLPEPVIGSMYLAEPGENPFGTTFALYMAVADTEERGVLVKVPGRVDLDPKTGQITTTFDDLPQFPFDRFTLSFRSGQRAPLVNPPTCGSKTIGIRVTSYVQPQKFIDASDSYEIDEGPGGTPCPASLLSRPFAPRLEAGTLNPVAGAFSPFVFRLTRPDTDQELARVDSVLPPGLLAKIAGVSECPDAAIAAIPDGFGTGRGELDDPTCPASSLIGSFNAGVGSGTAPNYFPGSVYLAGPYRGAPLSLVTVAPGLAGPYDLGNVVVRVALSVDPDTTRVKAVSDYFPAIVHGVLLRIRDIRLRVDRPETTVNPTNCEASSVETSVSGVGGDLFDVTDDSVFDGSNRFQVGECGNLRFKPELSFKLRGGTHRGDHPAFFSRLRGRPGDANIGRAIVALPRSEFLENDHIGTICTRVQFAAEECPAASIYGRATAKTPLLDEAISGPVVLRSSDNVLPDLVAVFRGRIDANLVGRIDSVRGGIRTSFESVPDVPVSEFTLAMRGGKKGLLVNSTNLCKREHQANVNFTSQSGKRLRLRPAVQNSCRDKRKAKRTHRRHHRRG